MSRAKLFTTTSIAFKAPSVENSNHPAHWDLRFAPGETKGLTLRLSLKFRGLSQSPLLL